MEDADRTLKMRIIGVGLDCTSRNFGLFSGVVAYVLSGTASCIWDVGCLP